MSEAAAWTARRYYGGRYSIVPNGVDLSAARPEPRPAGEDLEILFVGRAEGRKGLPVLLRAFEALRAAGVGARLTIAGGPEIEVQPLLLDPEGVRVVGPVDEDQKWRLLGSPTCSARPRWAARASAWCSRRPSPRAHRWWPPTSPATATWCATGATGCSCPPATPWRWARPCARSPPTPPCAPGWATPRASAPSASPGRRVTAEITEVYERAVELPRPERGWPARHAAWASRPPSPARAPRPSSCRRSSPQARAGPPPHGPDGAPVAAWRPRLAGVGLTALALNRLGIESIGRALLAATPVWVLLAFALMCASMLIRAEAWHAILRAAMPGMRVRRRDTARATMIGVLMSATLPARLGEPSRALIMSRRLGRVATASRWCWARWCPRRCSTSWRCGARHGDVRHRRRVQPRRGRTRVRPVAPVVVIGSCCAAGDPAAGQALALPARAAGRRHRARGDGPGSPRLQVFRRPRLGAWATLMQLTAWAVQWLACYVLLVALGLDEHAGIGAAAAVLFAVNVTAALPATPSNLGVFQAACVAVLSAYGVSKTNAFAYGVILQAVEIATALAMGMPALVGEGMTWKDLRLRALHAAPVELRAARRRESAEAEA